MTENNEAPQPTPKQEEVLDSLPATSEEVANELGITPSAVRSRIQRMRREGIEVTHDRESGRFHPPARATELPDASDSVATVDRSDVVSDLRGGGLTASDFSEKYDISKSSALDLLDRLAEDGHAVEYKEADQYGTKLWYIPEDRDKTYRAGRGDGVYRFALIGDTHLGSSSEHLWELHDFYDRLQEEGVSHVYHAGDITDGWEVHKGHINEVKGEAAGWDRLLQYTVENYPQRDGIDTFFIEGNHDRKYHRRNGLHFGELISRRRDDLHYCGDSQATFVFDEENDLDLELIHPSGGKPYTQGYRAQTLYRERPPSERPTIAGIGHLHGKLYANAEDVEAFYVGCWKGLTTWGKRKGHDSEIGGWILEIEIEDGELRRVSPDWVGYESRDTEKAYTTHDVEEMSRR